MGFRVSLGRDQGLGGAGRISIGQEGLGGASKILSRAGRAQRGLRCWLGERSGVDLEGTQGGLAAFGGIRRLRGSSMVGRAGGGSELSLSC